MRKIYLIFILAVHVLISSTAAKASVWQDAHQWSEEWEKKYAEWVRASFNEEIFVSGPYKGLATDCADAVYFARVIFCYENKLPFVIHDSTGGDSRVSNKMSRFDSISNPHQRARAFIAYVGDVTSTKTMPSDTYPVTINRRYVHAGTVWSRPSRRENNIIRRILKGSSTIPGHAEVVKKVSDTGVLTMIGSTVPKEVRQLHTTSSLVFMPAGTDMGLRNWMQPDDYGRPRSEIPGYSLEQFNSIGGDGNNRSMSRWNHEVQKRLALREETPGESINRQVDDICGLTNDRVELIAQSETRRRQLGGSCMDRDDYESYSSPSRDQRIKDTISQLIQTVGANDVSGLEHYFQRCPDIRIAPGRTLSLYDFAVHLMRGQVSANPNHSFESRWGLGSSFKLCKRY